jgi:hypothetical protein
MGSVRTKGMHKTKTVTLPQDETAQYTIRKASNRDDVERSNLFSKMRMIQNLGTPDELITERDIPNGELQVQTILMCLVGWNYEDENKRTYEITEDNILELMTAAERRALYVEILDFNPIWKGEEEGKEDSEENSSHK